MCAGRKGRRRPLAAAIHRGIDRHRRIGWRGKFGRAFQHERIGLAQQLSGQPVDDEDIPDLEELFPDTPFVPLQNAGHWVHAEAPDAFVNAVLEFCLR
mgnify:CR=1 FL=1